jgi:hypothetical protein
MKKVILLVICILIFKFSFAFNPNTSKNIMLVDEIEKVNTETILNTNYQQFKHQVINFETSDLHNYANLKKRRRSKDDNLMLYVAGGLAVATATLILTNNPENFTTNSASSVNMGIAIGGTVGCALFISKYFIDKTR